MKPVDILINATPVGMSPDKNKTPIPLSLLNKLKKTAVVFDIIYQPAMTKFLSAATKKGYKTISGFNMYILQAALQFQLFTN